MFDVVTFVSSLATSSLVAALLSGLYKQKKQNKALQIDRLEKALGLLRKDYEDLFAAADGYSKAPDEWNVKGKTYTPSVNPIDVQVVIMIVVRKVDADIVDYLKARSQILTYMNVPANSEKTRQDCQDNVSRGVVGLKLAHDRLLMAMVNRCHQLMGAK